jgi:hypothetical protein
MSISDETRLAVRQRANFACEYCGVSETDSGSELTIDHFQPRTKGGSDDLDNLLYCCPRCNQYKADYWAEHPGDAELWNPRYSAWEAHFLALADSTLYAVTDVGSFTLKRLRLNRAPLVAYRRQLQQRLEQQRLLECYREVVGVLERLYQEHQHQVKLLEEQQSLLQEQRLLIQRLLRRKGE